MGDSLGSLPVGGGMRWGGRWAFVFVVVVLLVFLEWARDEHVQDWTECSQER